MSASRRAETRSVSCEAAPKTKMISEKIVQELSEARKEPEWLMQMRVEAFHKFQQAPLPSFKHGLHIILQPEFDFERVKLKKSTETTPNLNEFRDKFATLPEKDKFFYLNLALAKIGLARARTGERISIELDRKEQFCHTLIIAEPNSQVSIAESVSGDEEYKSNFVEIFAARDAIVNFASIQNTDSKNYVSGKYASIKEDAKVNWFDATIGGGFVKGSVVSLLDGKNAETKNYGLFLGKKEQQFDLYSASVHNAEGTKSDILMKGVLKDKAKGLYRGLVKIDANARKADGYQKEEVLLLGEEAEADAIPNLEINNEEVRCTHGASVGNISSGKLFYLMSRGLSKEDATKIIVEGFFEFLLNKAGVVGMKKSIMENLR